jgi:1-acyl-sn-glycerol-3-phosphate acyltransferase
MGGNRFVERAVTDEVMYKLMKLSGQEYVDIYAATLKKSTPTGPTAVPEAGLAPATDVTRMPDTRAS